jgi:hypothetical protein
METQAQQPQKVTHWKKLTNPDYIGAHDLQPGQELTVTIENVSNQVVKCFDGKEVKEETCIVANIKGAKKPMILNKTNCKIIARLYDTPYIEDWVGKKIIIYAARVRAFGEVVEALRVKNQKVQ